MARRASIFTQTDLDRTVKAAAKVGYAVEILPGGVIRIAPTTERAENSPSDNGEANPWDAALR